jgi:hypothetical protein
MKNNYQHFKFEVGQIRKLDSIMGIASSRLVAIAEVDSKDATCLVFLLGNTTDAATPRDVVLSIDVTNLPYEVALMGDYLARADQARLVNNPILGHIPHALIENIRSAILDNPFGGIKFNDSTFGVQTGSYPAQKFDAVWTFRDAEAANFALLTFVRNKTSLEYAVKFYITNIAFNCNIPRKNRGRSLRNNSQIDLKFKWENKLTSLRSWKIESFKSVAHNAHIDLAPLTVVVGANSSGKSTLIQSILLMAQNALRIDEKSASKNKGLFDYCEPLSTVMRNI